jgi:hypothetical protein
MQTKQRECITTCKKKNAPTLDESRTSAAYRQQVLFLSGQGMTTAEIVAKIHGITKKTFQSHEVENNREFERLYFRIKSIVDGLS